MIFTRECVSRPCGLLGRQLDLDYLISGISALSHSLDSFTHGSEVPALKNRMPFCTQGISLPSGAEEWLTTIIVHVVTSSSQGDHVH